MLSALQDNQGRINSLAFHRSEDLMVTAGEDDSIHLYNLLSGSMEKVLMSKKHGVAHVAFTHHPQNVVYASRKVGRPIGPANKVACLCRLRTAHRSNSRMHCRHSAHLVSGCLYNVLVRTAASPADCCEQTARLCCTHPLPRLLLTVSHHATMNDSRKPHSSRGSVPQYGGAHALSGR